MATCLTLKEKPPSLPFGLAQSFSIRKQKRSPWQWHVCILPRAFLELHPRVRIQRKSSLGLFAYFSGSLNGARRLGIGQRSGILAPKRDVVKADRIGPRQGKLNRQDTTPSGISKIPISSRRVLRFDQDRIQQPFFATSFYRLKCQQNINSSIYTSASSSLDSSPITESEYHTTQNSWLVFN